MYKVLQRLRSDQGPVFTSGPPLRLSLFDAMMTIIIIIVGNIERVFTSEEWNPDTGTQEYDKRLTRLQHQRQNSGTLGLLGVPRIQDIGFKGYHV